MSLSFVFFFSFSFALSFSNHCSSPSFFQFYPFRLQPRKLSFNVSGSSCVFTSSGVLWKTTLEVHTRDFLSKKVRLVEKQDYAVGIEVRVRTCTRARVGLSAHVVMDVRIQPCALKRSVRYGLFKKCKGLV